MLEQEPLHWWIMDLDLFGWKGNLWSTLMEYGYVGYDEWVEIITHDIIWYLVWINTNCPSVVWHRRKSKVFEKCYSDMRHDACLGHTVAEIIVNQKTKRLTVNFVGLSVFKSHHLKNEHRAFIKKIYNYHHHISQQCALPLSMKAYWAKGSLDVSCLDLT